MNKNYTIVKTSNSRSLNVCICVVQCYVWFSLSLFVRQHQKTTSTRTRTTRRTHFGCVSNTRHLNIKYYSLNHTLSETWTVHFFESKRQYRVHTMYHLYTCPTPTPSYSLFHTHRSGSGKSHCQRNFQILWIIPFGTQLNNNN